MERELNNVTREEEEEKKKKKKRFLFWLFFLAFLAIAVVFYLTREPEESAPLISGDLLPAVRDARDRDINEIAQELADKDNFTMIINPEVVFSDGESEGSIGIVNPETNVYPIAVDIRLEGSEEIIYSSGAIQPDQYVEDVKLNTVLDKGDYTAIATFNIYDPDTLERQGKLEATIQITVEN